jgi:high-affinity iron transporter
MAQVFSVVALFIMFREALEAAVVISIMLQLCHKLKMQQLKRWVWFGALAGLGLSITIAVIFVIIYYAAQNAVFSGRGKVVFESFLFLVASYLITVLGFAMLKVKGYEQKWELKLRGATMASAQSKSARSAVFLLAFTTTLREGLECVVFIAGTSGGVDAKSIPLPALVGIIMGTAVGVILYYTGKKISDISWFIIIMCAFLFLLAAGMFSRAVTYWQQLGWFGYFGLPESDRPWQNQFLWDKSACCSQDINQNGFFGILSALLGYTDHGTAMWLFAYFTYWLEVAIVIIAKATRGSLMQAKIRRQPAVVQMGQQHSKSSSRSGSESDLDPKVALPTAKSTASEVDPKIATEPGMQSGSNSGRGSSEEEEDPKAAVQAARADVKLDIPQA